MFILGQVSREEHIQFRLEQIEGSSDKVNKIKVLYERIEGNSSGVIVLKCQIHFNVTTLVSSGHQNLGVEHTYRDI
jgi:hypothetical protein